MLKGTFIYWSRTGQCFLTYLRIRAANHWRGQRGGGGEGWVVERVWGNCYDLGCFPFSPKFGEFRLEIKSNAPFWFSPTGITTLTNPLILISHTKLCPFPFDNFLWLSLVPLFGILLTRTITKCAVAWVWSVQPECTVPLGTWNFWNFKLDFLLNGKGPLWQCQKLEFSNGWCNSEQKFWVLKQFTSFIIFQL